MMKHSLVPFLILGALGVVPSLAGCSTDASARRESEGAGSALSNNCITVGQFPVCDDEHGRFKSTYEKFGLASIGLPLTGVEPDGNGDWTQIFERVQLNGNMPNGCEEGRACISRLGWEDLAEAGQPIGEAFTDCNDPAFGPRENLRCMPQGAPNEFVDHDYYKDGGLERFGHMLTPVLHNCATYPDGLPGDCFWTERAKVSRLNGQNAWQGEQLGRKKLMKRNDVPPSDPPLQLPQPVAKDPSGTMSPGTVYLPKETRGLVAYRLKDTHAYVCEAAADPALVEQFRKFDRGEIDELPTVVVETANGEWSTRRAEPPLRRNLDYLCAGGMGWELWLWEDSSSFLDNVDFGGAFVKQFNGKGFECTGELGLQGIVLDVQRYQIKDGKLMPPTVNIGLKGKSAGVAVTCSVKAETPELWAYIGGIPVMYRLSIAFSVGVKLSAGTSFEAVVGTDGARFHADGGDSREFEFKPSLELGATFYKTLNTSLGFGVPIKVIGQPDGCTPKVEASVTLTAGMSLNFVPAKVEWEGQVLGPWTLRESVCP